jgi:hypothetical protein
MRTRIALVVAALVLAVVPVGAVEKGNPDVKSISALAFGPNGVLFIGDTASAKVFAIETADTAPAGKGDVMVDKLGDKLGSALGTTSDNVTVNDVKVNPSSGNIYIGVTRKGAGGGPVVMKLDREGKLSEFALKDVTFTEVSLPAGEGGKGAKVSMTSLAFVSDKLVIAGLSNEEFASTLWTVAYPFSKSERGTGIKIFHGAHGRLETNAPIQTFTPYKIGAADYLMAAYTCTPLVKIPVTDLKAGAKVDGTTIAELGNRNKPLDMVVYSKGGKDYVLIANSARGVMKVPAEPFEKAEPITTRPAGEKAGVGYETIAELKGVQHLDKLDAERAVVLIAEGKDLTLKSVPLP